MIKIEKIPTKQTYSIRQEVLRKGKPIETCYFDGDNLASTNHFGIFIDKHLTGIVSVFHNNNATFSNKHQFQLRGMAILPDFQNKGIGKLLIEEVEKEIFSKQKNEILIWFNARKSAVPFYERLHYHLIDNPFEVAEIGTHYIMHKIILF
jgi:GNAT superfamily N-acetyltransferase